MKVIWACRRRLPYSHHLLVVFTNVHPPSSPHKPTQLQSQFKSLHPPKLKLVYALQLSSFNRLVRLASLALRTHISTALLTHSNHILHSLLQSSYKTSFSVTRRSHLKLPHPSHRGLPSRLCKPHTQRSSVFGVQPALASLLGLGVGVGMGVPPALLLLLLLLLLVYAAVRADPAGGALHGGAGKLWKKAAAAAAAATIHAKQGAAG